MTSPERRLSLPGLAAVIVVYLVIVQGLGVALSAGTDADYATFPDVDTVLRAMTIPVAVSTLFGVTVISILRQWPQTIHEDHPVRTWVWIVPGLMALTSLGVVDYENLGSTESGLLVTVVVSSLLVGIGEELMFRGIAINSLRDHGMPESKVALWSSIIFGAAHITNLISEGSQALVQVLVVSVSGYFFYLAYRVSGTILVPILLHAMWDFAQFSHNVGDADPSPQARQALPLLVQVVLVVIVVARRRVIEPDGAATPVPAT